MSTAEQAPAGDDEPGDGERRRLAGRARRGDRDALARLLRSLQDVLFRVCRSRLGDDHAAHDATQETALRLVRQIERFRGDSSPRTWAIGVALNVCRETRRKRTALTATAEQLHEQPGKTAGPAATAAKAETAQLVRRLVQQLPTRQAEAVTLRHLEQLSVAETAAAMGCSEGTVKAAAWQGLRTLRSQLHDQRLQDE